MAGKRQADDRSWFDLEAQGSEFPDTRLRHRFATLLEKLWEGMGQTIPFACQDWASTRAAYRFLSNDRVSERDNLSGHFQASAARVRATDGPVLILQDTTSSRTRGSAPNSSATRARRLSERERMAGACNSRSHSAASDGRDT
ncbi:IS4/Tn5 family transposase DNA-binding protein [Paraburkholderia hospita]|uniref:IS4/Tn5 family transposase DNA-binding protein n=1 Tax=Paraburkholderia hospita TaxID=169430 RepID=UPI000586CF2F|nr:Transposase DNA-binding [Burkholderia sp. CF099]